MVTKTGSNLSTLLLEQGFGYLNTTSADLSSHINAYYSAEIRAKAGKKHLWVNYNPNEIKEKREESSEPIETQEVVVTELAPTGQLYVQIVGSGVQQLEKLMADFAEYHKAPPAEGYEPKKGELCSARFSADNQWYRARILKTLPNGDAEVHYVDFGNVSLLPFLKKKKKQKKKTDKP